MLTKYHICVSGSARGPAVELNDAIAYETGKAIARAGHLLMTGATIGIPDRAAEGCKAAGGHSIGISPAATRLEHIKKYNLPSDHYDFILYTGMHYIGRDALLVSSSDAVVSIGGRIGTVHEFAIALELGKPIGILSGTGGTSEWFDELMHAAGIREPAAYHVLFDSNPSRLIRRLTKVLTTIDKDDMSYTDELTSRS
jgi:uncharacterized protein (TIGR00725 family)